MSINRSLSLNDSIYQANFLSEGEGDETIKKSYTFTAKSDKKKLDIEEATEIEKEKVVVNNIQTVGKT